MLQVVLTFGNYLNAGSFRGNAAGVKIQFLSELRNTKSTPTYSMLHYLIEARFER